MNLLAAPHPAGFLLVQISTPWPVTSSFPFCLPTPFLLLFPSLPKVLLSMAPFSLHTSDVSRFTFPSGLIEPRKYVQFEPNYGLFHADAENIFHLWLAKLAVSSGCLRLCKAVSNPIEQTTRVFMNMPATWTDGRAQTFTTTTKKSVA